MEVFNAAAQQQRTGVLCRIGFISNCAPEDRQPYNIAISARMHFRRTAADLSAGLGHFRDVLYQQKDGFCMGREQGLASNALFSQVTFVIGPLSDPHLASRLKESLVKFTP